MKTAFQTPSSNSCSKSTASIEKKLKPNAESFSENAFCKEEKGFSTDSELSEPKSYSL